MKKSILLIVLFVASLVAATTASATGVEKITICHAAGLDGTTKFVTLELPYQAVYGNGGHFNENGTTQAGHEDDYLGACNEEPPIECPDGDFNGEEEGCGEPPVECPDGDYNGEEEGCGQPPVECPDGDYNGQEPGCGEPPVECPDGDMNGELPGCDEIVVPPVDPPCTPRNPDGSPGGKDGIPGNDDCAADPVPPVVPPVVTPPTVTPPVVEPPVVKPPVVKPKPPVVEKPKPTKPEVKEPKPVKPQAKPQPKPDKAPPVETTSTETLPYTGVSLLWFVALGAWLVGLGTFLVSRRWS